MLVVNVHFMDRDSAGEGTKNYNFLQAKIPRGKTWGKRESVGENVREKNGDFRLVFVKKLRGELSPRDIWLIHLLRHDRSDKGIEAVEVGVTTVALIHKDAIDSLPMALQIE